MKKIMLLLLAVALVMIVALNLLQRTKQEIETSITQFFALSSVADTKARGFLAADFPNKDALLQAMQVPNLFYLGEFESEPQLLSLSRATLTISLGIQSQAGWRQPVDVEFVKEAGEWKIQSFPQLQTVPVAIITKIYGQTTTFLDGNGNEFSLDSGQYFRPKQGAQPDVVGKAGFVVSVAGHLSYFEEFQRIPINKLLTVTASTLEAEELGFFPLAANAVFFRPQHGALQIAGVEDFIVGMKELIFYQQHDDVVAVVMPENYTPDKVRVALNTTGFSSLIHGAVRVSADSALTLTDKVAGISTKITAGQVVSFSANGDGVNVSFLSGEQRTFANRLFIIADSGRIRIESIQRGSPVFTPAYRGHLEIKAYDGQLSIVNEVPLEAYLYSVVPSEMPISFGLVPLQVQSVAARSYAVASIYHGGLGSLAAHVDDSTSSQVYNNVPEYPISNQAVNDTAGSIVTYNGEIVDARFFSTSAGVTGNFNEVWHDTATGAFPGTPVPYLVSKAQLRRGTLPDISAEAGARTFFTSTDWDSFDRPSPWFRWDVEMSRSELEAVISKYLPERQRAQRDFVLTLENGQFVKKDIPSNPLGELVDLRVIRRGGGGNVFEIEVEGKNGTYRLLKEYTIRFTIRPVKTGNGRDIPLRRHDGSAVNNYIILPSTYMVMDIARDNHGKIQTVRFRGGGNGHGVGMSQYGVRGLAEDGRTIAEILSHYYPGSTVEQVY